MTNRTKYYKAAELSLGGPHHGRGITYLPGETYTPDYLDEDPSVSCTHGLYYTSHQRVAARWGPVVMEVEVLGKKVKATTKVKPTHVPAYIDSGRYNKYRTDLLRVKRIVGIAVYTDFTSGQEERFHHALTRVNEVLTHHRKPKLVSTGEVLQRLRDDRFLLHGVMHEDVLPESYRSRRTQYLARIDTLHHSQRVERERLRKAHDAAMDALGQRHLNAERALKALYSDVAP